MKNQRFLSALAATVMAVSLFTCTALAANEPADTAASEPTQQTEVVTADTDTGTEKGALAKYSDFITALEASCSLSVFAPSVLAHCT